MLREKLKNLMAAQKALVTAAVTEGRGLTTDEQTTYNSQEVEIKGLEATIKAKDVLDAKEAAAKKPVNEPLFAQPKDHKEVLPFATFGEQLIAIAKSSSPDNSFRDPRLLEIQNAAGANESVPSEGGFLVQKDFRTDLTKDIYTDSILAGQARKIPLSGNSNGIKINGVDETSRANGSRWGGVQGYWADEAATVTATKPKFRQIELTLNKLMAIGYATEELLQDASALQSIMFEAFRDELRFKVEDGMVNGTGSGQLKGILNAGCLVSQAKESGQTAATIVYENIINMYSRLHAGSRANAAWYINQEIEPQLMSMALSVGTGGMPVYLPANGISGKPYGTILGMPVKPIEQAAALGTKGDIILGDMSKYLIADKGGMKSDVSMHVRFLYDEQAFRVVYRVDGQPLRSKVMTPFKGSNTLSHFVALATRA